MDGSCQPHPEKEETPMVFGVLFLRKYDTIENISAACLSPYHKGESRTALHTIF